MFYALKKHCKYNTSQSNAIFLDNVVLGHNEVVSSWTLWLTRDLRCKLYNDLKHIQQLYTTCYPLYSF